MNYPTGKNKIIIALLLVIILASALRLYKLGIIPPSLSWDETAVGYNGWTIANYARDEWGKLLPFYFISFLDDKHPVHIYTTAIFVKILGLSEFSVRIPSAIFGILNVLFIFLLGRRLFRSNLIGLFSAFLLAISPYAIHFSRFNHEANFALFFFMSGLYLFLTGLERKNYLLSLSFLFFGIDLLTYHSAKVMVPPMILLLSVMYFKDLGKVKFYSFLGFFFFFVFILIIAFNPVLLGTARVKQTSVSQGEIHKTYLYEKTGSDMFGYINLVYDHYISFFTPEYLFISGDKNPRLGIHTFGQFYPVEVIFFILGTVALVRYRFKVAGILISWLFLAPLPASLVGNIPDGARSLYLMGSLHLLSGLGMYTLINFFKRKQLKIATSVTIFLILAFFLKSYLGDYYQNYNNKNPTEWQFGMKQVVEYIKKNPQYSQVFMTNIRSQPYIFFLFYLKTPLPEFLKTVQYNYSDTRSFNLVYSFDKYIFDGFDPIEISPDSSKLYIVTPSQYDGLRYKNQFKVKKIINYPNGADDFFIVSVN